MKYQLTCVVDEPLYNEFSQVCKEENISRARVLSHMLFKQQPRFRDYAISAKREDAFRPSYKAENEALKKRIRELEQAQGVSR